MNNIKKIMLVIMAVIIIAGIIMICVKGFNYDFFYSKTQRLNIYMTKDFEMTDMETIANDVFNDNKVRVLSGNLFGTVASIVAEEINDEQENAIIEKINQKYEIELDRDNDVILSEVPKVNVWDLAVRYISPIIISTIIILIYNIIRYRKQGIATCIIVPVLNIVLALALYVSLFAICRIPVNEFFIIFGMLIYILTIVYSTITLNKQKVNQ